MLSEGLCNFGAPQCLGNKPKASFLCSDNSLHSEVPEVRRDKGNPIDQILEARGIEVCLVNAQHVKTSVLDGVRFDQDGKSNLASPIHFATFRWLDDSLARRSPLSVAALLETAAMLVFWLDWIIRWETRIG
jgi:hypothetical protein